MNQDEIRQLSGLIETMRHLRSPAGCAWDRGQSPESLSPYILEEAYELVDAIDSGNLDDIRSELGDLLLQVIFQAQIYTERDLFGIGDIAEGIDKKLQRRHPQLFSAQDLEKYPSDWEQIKQQELKEKGKSTDFFSRQPKNLPALKLADKCCRHLNKQGTLDDISISAASPSNIHQENIDEDTLGAALFNLVSQAQNHEIDCDLALRKYLRKIFSKDE